VAGPETLGSQPVPKQTQLHVGTLQQKPLKSQGSLEGLQVASGAKHAVMHSPEMHQCIRRTLS